MSSKNTYTPELIPEEAVPKQLADKNLYKPSGYACQECKFISNKKGFAGRQALRAHLKKHKNERRAWQGPFIRQVLVVAIILGFVAVERLG